MTVREMRRCANPSCAKMVAYIRNSEKSEYCSYSCRSAFSPVMRRVCIDNLISCSQESLRALIREMQSEKKTNLDIAVIFDIGTKTLRLWIKKLEV